MQLSSHIKFVCSRFLSFVCLFVQLVTIFWCCSSLLLRFEQGNDVSEFLLLYQLNLINSTSKITIILVEPKIKFNMLIIVKPGAISHHYFLEI